MFLSAIKVWLRKYVFGSGEPDTVGVELVMFWIKKNTFKISWFTMLLIPAVQDYYVCHKILNIVPCAIWSYCWVAMTIVVIQNRKKKRRKKGVGILILYYFTSKMLPWSEVDINKGKRCSSCMEVALLRQWVPLHFGASGSWILGSHWELTHDWMIHPQWRHQSCW